MESELKLLNKQYNLTLEEFLAPQINYSPSPEVFQEEEAVPVPIVQNRLSPSRGGGYGIDAGDLHGFRPEPFPFLRRPSQKPRSPTKFIRPKIEIAKLEPATVPVVSLGFADAKLTPGFASGGTKASTSQTINLLSQLSAVCSDHIANISAVARSENSIMIDKLRSKDEVISRNDQNLELVSMQFEDLRTSAAEDIQDLSRSLARANHDIVLIKAELETSERQRRKELTEKDALTDELYWNVWTERFPWFERVKRMTVHRLNSVVFARESFTSEAMSEFGRILPSFSSFVSEVCLEQCIFEDDSFVPLMEGICNLNKLNSFEINSCIIQTQHFAQLISSMLLSQPNLEKLTIVQVPHALDSNDDLFLLSNGIRECRDLKTIRIAGCSFPTDSFDTIGINSLSSALLGCHLLESVYLPSCSIGSESIVCLGCLFSGDLQIECIDLSDNGFGREGAIGLARSILLPDFVRGIGGEELKKSTPLRPLVGLYLGDNFIGNDGLAALSLWIKCMRNLGQLNLSNSSIQGVEGSRILVDSLRIIELVSGSHFVHVPPLTTFSFAQNKIGGHMPPELEEESEEMNADLTTSWSPEDNVSSGFPFLCRELLFFCHELEWLDLSRCGLTSNDVACLGNCIRDRRLGKLKNLWLNNNPIGPKGVENLFRDLDDQQIAQLKVLGLENCCIEKQGGRFLMSVFSSRNTEFLSVLYIRDNRIAASACRGIVNALLSLPHFQRVSILQGNLLAAVDVDEITSLITQRGEHLELL